MAVGCGRTLGKVQSCGVCSGRGYSHSILARLLERSYSLKELYQEFFVCAMVQDALISDLILYAPDGGGRSWNLLFHHEFND